jgi:hypothetical protein
LPYDISVPEPKLVAKIKRMKCNFLGVVKEMKKYILASLYSSSMTTSEKTAPLKRIYTQEY